MPDMLVKLYSLPDHTAAIRQLNESGIIIRRALAPELHLIREWVNDTFHPAWASECEVAFSNHPVSCFIATENQKLIGFACYDSTCKNLFGPTGVHDGARGKGVGKALLLASLNDMYSQGYAYAVIGGAGPTEFYANAVGAVIIEDSVPGIYKGLLR